MRHQHVRGIAAVDGDAQRARRIAHMLVAPRAQPAFAAADPGIGGIALALVHALRLGAHRLHRAGDLVAEGERAAAGCRARRASGRRRDRSSRPAGECRSGTPRSGRRAAAPRCPEVRASAPRSSAAACRSRSAIGEASGGPLIEGAASLADIARLVNTATVALAGRKPRPARRVTHSQGAKYHERQHRIIKRIGTRLREEVPRCGRGGAARALARAGGPHRASGAPGAGQARGSAARASSRAPKPTGLASVKLTLPAMRMRHDCCASHDRSCMTT